MVFFTCQHCGDPVKKPAVEKHYNTKCRFRSPHLTCVDCLKDFGREDYGSHNQCMTEAQRYSAQGTVFKEQKGKKKQELYVEMIQKILNSKDLTLSRVQRELLEVCSNFDNVPRKPKPFKNFMANIARAVKHKQEDLDTVYNVIENAWKKEAQTNNASPDKEKQHQMKETNFLQETTMSNTTVQNKTDDELTDDKTKSDKHKKGKKVKHSDSSLISEGILNDEATNNTCIEVKMMTNDQNNSKPKKTKKKINNESNLNVDNNADEENMVSPTGSIKGGANKVLNESKDKHKRKSKCLDNEDVGNVDFKDGGTNENDTKENINVISKKQLKKQKKYEKYLKELENETQLKIGNENSLNGEDQESNDIKKTKKKNKKLKQKNNDLEDNELAKDNTVNEKPIHSKKRKLEEIGGETQEKKMKENSEEALATATGAFSWADVIFRVLNSQPDKELSLKKLGKKVVKEYQTVKQDHRTYEELLHKFNKKVNKIKGVRVLRDRAKLIE